MNILVTGNLGYNGPLLVQELRSKGDFVVGLDAGFFLGSNFSPLRPFLPDVQIFKDIRELQKEDLVRFGIEKIVHLAALSNDPLGEISPQQTIEINTGATKRLFGIAQELGVRHFVYASSCSIYGKMGAGQLATEAIPLEPLTAYAKSKALSEAFLAGMQGGATKTTVMRYATMFGASPQLRLDLVVNNLVAHGLLFGSVKILSDGTPWRPVLHVRDFASLTCGVLHNDIYGTFNTGFNSLNYQIKGIGSQVSEMLGSPIEINPQKTPDERSYRVDFSKIAAMTYPEPKFGMREGISELVGAYREHCLSKEDFESGKYVRAKALKKIAGFQQPQ